MSNNRRRSETILRLLQVIFWLTGASAIFALFGSDANPPSVAAALLAVGAGALAWYLGARQDIENIVLAEQVDELELELERRTETELGTAAAIAGQGELATWSYARLVRRLRRDGHIR